MEVNKVKGAEDWNIFIDNNRGLFDLNLKDLWRYRDLLYMFVKRDFVSFYKQTILGPLWFFIQPLFTTIVFSFVFGGLAGISTDGLPRHLFYLSGITAWAYFSDCISSTSTVFSANAHIFGKVYFPRLIMPLSIVVSGLVKFFVQFLLFLFFMLFYWYKGADFQPTYAVFLFPYLVLLMAMLGLGLGMTISAMTTKYRDLKFLITFGIQLLMYATPVIYPLSMAKEKFRDYAHIIELNPMSNIIEAFRFAFLGTGEFSLSGIIYSSVVTFVILLFGIIVFNYTEKNFIDTI